MTYHNNSHNNPVFSLSIKEHAHAVLHHITSENLAYFQDNSDFYSNPNSQDYLDEIFYQACFNNVSPGFLDDIIALGVKDLTSSCVTGLLLKGHYTLLEYVLTHYAEKFNINLFTFESFDICSALIPLMAKGEHHNLFKMIIQVLPNHTQKPFRRDKYYVGEERLIQSYTIIYNRLLDMAFEQKNYSNVNKDAIDDIIHLIAQKKFPLNKANCLIAKTCYPLLFEKRLKPRMNSVHEPDYINNHTMASQRFLNRHLNSHTSSVMKTKLYLEITNHIAIPEQVNVIIYQFIMTKSQQRRQIADDETCVFMQGIQHKPHLFNYFNRFINFELTLLNKTLHAELIDNISNQAQINPPNSEICVKI